MDFRLNEEQLEFQQTCRRFAREVIRPVAAKYDREESVPWDVIKAAREWGLHGLDHIQRMGQDPDGVYSCIYAEELHWGCAGIALAIQGGSLAAAGIASSGTPEQIGRWVPECFGEGDEIKLGAYAVTEAGAGSDVRSLQDHRQAGRRRVDPERHEGLHHERRHRRRDRGRGHRGPGPRPPRPGLVPRPEGHPGALDGQEGVEARHPRVADRRGRPRRLPHPDGVPAGRLREAPEEARARPLGPVHGPLLRARSRRSSSPARWSAPRRSASRRRRTSGRSSTSRTSRRTACRCSSSSASSRRSPTWRPRSRPPACWCGAPPGWAATASR